MPVSHILETAKTKMEKTKDVLRADLMAIRAGRANPQLLDRITVDYYGTPTPLKNVANISAPEPRVLQINPWDAKMVKDISKAILASDLGLTPSNDGKVIRLMLDGKLDEAAPAIIGHEFIGKLDALDPVEGEKYGLKVGDNVIADIAVPCGECLLCRTGDDANCVNMGVTNGGDINEYTQFDPDNDNRQTLPRFQPGAIRKNLRIVEVLNAFGRTRGYTPAQIALAWLMHKGDFIVPIPGTTKLSHLEENLRAAEITFSAEEMDELEAAVSAIPVTGSRYDALQESKVQK